MCHCSEVTHGASIFVVALVFSTLLLPCPILINHFQILSCPALYPWEMSRPMCVDSFKILISNSGAHLGIFNGRGGFQKKGTIFIMETIACKNLKNLSSVLDLKFSSNSVCENPRLNCWHNYYNSLPTHCIPTVLSFRMKLSLAVVRLLYGIH